MDTFTKAEREYLRMSMVSFKNVLARRLAINDVDPAKVHEEYLNVQMATSLYHRLGRGVQPDYLCAAERKFLADDCANMMRWNRAGLSLPDGHPMSHKHLWEEQAMLLALITKLGFKIGDAQRLDITR